MSCECGGYQYQDEYNSRMMADFFQKHPEEQSELDQFLAQYVETQEHIPQIRSAIWCILCADCGELRVRFKSNLDRMLDEHRRRDVY